VRVLVTVAAGALAVIAVQPIVCVVATVIVATGPVFPLVGLLAAVAYMATCGNEDKK
jgi:hypothetical protein